MMKNKSIILVLSGLIILIGLAFAEFADAKHDSAAPEGINGEDYHQGNDYDIVYSTVNQGRYYRALQYDKGGYDKEYTTEAEVKKDEKQGEESLPNTATAEKQVSFPKKIAQNKKNSSINESIYEKSNAIIANSSLKNHFSIKIIPDEQEAAIVEGWEGTKEKVIKQEIIPDEQEAVSAGGDDGIDEEKLPKTKSHANTKETAIPVYGEKESEELNNKEHKENIDNKKYEAEEESVNIIAEVFKKIFSIFSR